MERIDVIPGVCLVLVPEAGLSVLCGSPADVVKHLMRRGLIASTEERGVRFETGPNAILLSDVSVQNGQFSNLAEFPVLQMLYRQGMIVPGHPRNTGRRPLLIGLAEQLRAQSEYIRLGNYGLPSVEAISKAGLRGDKARDLWRMKLRFAFDKIRSADELLDFRVVDREVITLAEGLRLRRLGSNRYQFIHEAQTVSVDMNLADRSGYRPPYHLDHHRVEREYFSVIHTGEGDGWDPDHPCMASIITYQGRIYLIDAGPNVLSSLVSLGISINEISGVFHTHCHDDHFAGLPSLMRSGHRIPYHAAPVVRRTAELKLGALLGSPPERFSQYFEVHDLTPEVWNDVDGMEVRPVLAPHPVETTLLFFRATGEDGDRTYGHLADLVSYATLEGMLTDDPVKSGLSPEAADAYRELCRRPLTVKKVDIGGGLIHGQATDFRGDGSGKLLLSHKSGELTPAEKEIGSSATFGTQDVLIPARCDHIRRTAERYLVEHLPGARGPDLHMLLNGEIREHNAGLILMKKDTPVTDVYLILSGVVEFLDAPTGVQHALATGSFVGGLGALSGEPSNRTYRTASYVRTLRMPAGLYRGVAERNGLMAQLKEVQELRHLLQNSWLFGEMVPFSTQAAIAARMGRLELSPDEPVPAGNGSALYLLAEGSVDLIAGRRVVESIGPDGFWGEQAILDTPNSVLEARTRIASVAWEVPVDAIVGIPIVRIKLEETLERRRKTLAASFDFVWDETFALGIPEIDREHAAIFAAIAAIERAAGSGETHVVPRLVRELIRVLRGHFAHEETVLEKVGYAGLAVQKARHAEYLARADALAATEAGDLAEIFRDVDKAREWIILHTLIEDRKYRAAVLPAVR